MELHRRTCAMFEPMIPISNLFGWLLTGMGLMAILNLILKHDRRRVATSTGSA
jgi:putative membrane protein